MKEWYFYQEQGKTMGPLSRDDVRKRIVDGKLRLYDLLYMEGHEQWRMALEFPEFKDDFALSPFATTAGKTWVLLHRKNPDTKDFVTSGPFSQQEVIARLKSGKLAYTDYGWRDGFKEWRRLSSLEEFSPQGSPEKRELPPTPVEKIMSAPTESLLSKVVEVKKKVMGEPPPPPEVFGRDLTKPGAAPPPPPPPTKVKMIEIKREEAPNVAGPTMHITTTTIVEDDDDTIEISETKKKRRKRKRFDFTVGEWILNLFMIAAMGGAIYFVGSSFNLFGGSGGTVVGQSPPEEAPVPEEAAPPATPPPPRPPPEPQAQTQPVPEEPTPPAPQAGSRVQETDELPPSSPPPPPVNTNTPPPAGALRLNVQVSKNKVNFTVRSGSKDPVIVQIIGLPGQIVGSPSFYRYQWLKPKANGLIPVDSNKITFTAGRYLIRATRGDVVKEEKFSVGTGGADFQKQLTHARKMYSQELWRDRLKLMKVSDQLENYIAQKIRQPKKSIRLGDLSLLNDLKYSNGGKYILFDSWWEFKAIFEEAKKSANPGLLEKLVESRRRLSQMTIWR